VLEIELGGSRVFLLTESFLIRMHLKPFNESLSASSPIGPMHDQWHFAPIRVPHQRPREDSRRYTAHGTAFVIEPMAPLLAAVTIAVAFIAYSLKSWKLISRCGRLRKVEPAESEMIPAANRTKAPVTVALSRRKGKGHTDVEIRHAFAPHPSDCPFVLSRRKMAPGACLLSSVTFLPPLPALPGVSQTWQQNRQTACCDGSRGAFPCDSNRIVVVISTIGHLPIFAVIRRMTT
jgi:hypothetical protein